MGDADGAYVAVQRETVTSMMHRDKASGGVAVIFSTIPSHVRELKEAGAVLVDEGMAGSVAWAQFCVPARRYSPATGVAGG